MGVFNTLEAAVRWGVPRYVNVSSETVPGLLLPRAPVPARLRAGRRGAPDPPAGPLRDRQVLLRAADGRRDAPLGHPLPHDPPELGPVGGQLRPQPRPRAARPDGRRPSASLWAYIDVYDLADALRLAAESDLDTHEVFYIACPDNHANRPLAELIRHHHGDEIELRELARPDASGPQHREGRAAARLRPAALLARLPDRGRRAARRRPRAARAPATPASSAGARSARRLAGDRSAGPRLPARGAGRPAPPRRRRPGRASPPRAGPATSDSSLSRCSVSSAVTCWWLSSTIRCTSWSISRCVSCDTSEVPGQQRPARLARQHRRSARARGSSPSGRPSRGRSRSAARCRTPRRW